jgi:hypothetical protein
MTQRQMTWAVAAGLLSALLVPALHSQSPTALDVRAVLAARVGVTEWTPPRTPWGDPDIQGYFSNAAMRDVPLERPAELGERALLTDAELAARQARHAEAERRALSETVTPSAPVFRNGQLVLSGPTHWAERGDAPSRRTSLVIDPASGRIPALTEEARRRPRPPARGSTLEGPWAGPEELSLYDRCISRGLPGSMMPAIYGTSYQIVQAPGVVAIRYEMIHETRVIPLQGSPSPAPSARAYMGDSRGRWEGNSLVVEATNFTAPYRNANGARFRLIERFTPVAPGVVEWTVTVDDPSTWTQPWTFSVPLDRTDTEPLFEYACHEGNYAMRNILAASRAAEQAGTHPPPPPAGVR